MLSKKTVFLEWRCFVIHHNGPKVRGPFCCESVCVGGGWQQSRSDKLCLPRCLSRHLVDWWKLVFVCLWGSARVCVCVWAVVYVILPTCDCSCKWNIASKLLLWNPSQWGVLQVPSPPLHCSKSPPPLHISISHIQYSCIHLPDIHACILFHDSSA